MCSSSASRVALVFGTAALIALALTTASLLGSRSPEEEPLALRGGAETEALLRGIPQEGIALGSPDAPVTLVEYADLQCPYCAQWAREAFPAIVDEYVRPGRVRIVFRGLAFIGPESEAALRTALAAGAQGRLWNLVHLLYRNQGAENGGWVTDDFLHRLGHQVRGLNPERAFAERRTPSVDRELAAAARAAEASGIAGTPSFEAGPTGGALVPVGRDEIRARLDALLAG